jgi:polyvinyl alcohol dehydrogenase (cytochrome)
MGWARRNRSPGVSDFTKLAASGASRRSPVRQRSGKILWQTATPGACSTSIPNVAQGCMALGPASAANGVVFAGSMNPAPGTGTMFALDSKTGKILWQYAAGSTVNAGPAIVGNSVYWGSGYARFGLGTGNTKLFAFSIGDDDH